MTALAADRNTAYRENKLYEHPVGTAQKIYAGAIVMRNATGYAVKGVTATGQTPLGVAQEQVDNTSGADGAKTVKVRRGLFKFAQDATITRVDIGGTAYVVDDQTVADNNGTSTRSALGVIRDVDSDNGVWVEITL